MSEKTLNGKIALVVGVGDDQGFGWGIAKSLAEQGARILIGTWPPICKIFTTSLEQGKFRDSQVLRNGSLLHFENIYPIDALYDKMEDVPLEVKNHRRYRDLSNYAIADLASAIKEEHGSLDILVHSLANAPEVQKPLLETSRSGYLAAMNASTYSLTSLIAHLGPLMPCGGAVLTLSYLASQQVIPGYGGGMSSAKAALESDVRTLAWEAGRRFGIRVNAISAGPTETRASRAIGFIGDMIRYSKANAPLQEELETDEVGDLAAFLCSPQAKAVTGSILYADHGLHAMGIAVDSLSLQPYPKAL